MLSLTWPDAGSGWLRRRGPWPRRGWPLVGVVLDERHDAEVLEGDLGKWGGERPLIGGLAQVSFEFALQLGEVHFDLDSPLAVDERLALGAAGERADDVMVEPQAVAAHVADRFLGENQAEPEPVGGSLAFLGRVGVGRLGRLGGDLDPIALELGGDLDVGPGLLVEGLVDEAAEFLVPLFGGAIGPPPTSLGRPFRNVVGVPRTSSP